VNKLVSMDTSDCLNISDVFDKACKQFKTNMLDRNNRPKLNGKEIFVPINWLKDHKSEIFWHVASIEKKEKLDILPCTNSIESSLCDDNCINGKDYIELKNGYEREKCLYRATRLGWISEIIEMYNNKDKRVLYWEKKHHSGKDRMFLRYIEEENDYLVVFEGKSKKRVIFITGYPVFYIDAKKKCDKEYKKYIDNKCK